MINKYCHILSFFLITTLTSACGGGGEESAAVDTPPAKSINTAPEISAFKSSYQLRENNKVILENLIISDAEGDNLTISFSGVDAEFFSYDTNTATLTFKSAPDYENPQDIDKNNTYAIELIVSDAELSTTATLEVKVINDIAIEIISPIGNSNIGGGENYKVLAKINDMEPGGSSSLSSAQVLINGNAAEVFDESFLHWVVELEISAVNSIKAELIFDGTSYFDDIEVTGLQPLSSVQNIVVDEEVGFLYMDDTLSNSIVKVSIDGVSSSVFFDFIGHDLSNPSSILLDKKNGRLLVASNIPRIDGKGAIIAIDLITQKHEVLSSELKGSGNVFSNFLGSMALYKDNIVISDVNNQSLVLVDSNNGDRSTLSSEVLGSGPDLERNLSLTVDSSIDIAYVSSGLSESIILKVNLLTGDRTVITDINEGMANSFLSASGFFFDIENNQLIFHIQSKGTSILDFATGSSQIIPNTSLFGKHALSFNNMLYRFNQSENSIERIDLDGEGVKTIINTKQGQNNQITGSFGSVFNSKLQKLFFMDSIGVMSFDIESKEVSLLSGINSCNCPPLPMGSGQGMTMTKDNKQLLIFRKDGLEETALLSVNISDGTRAVISAYDITSEFNFTNPIDVVIDHEDAYSYVLDSSNHHGDSLEVKIFQVNMKTGEKTLVSSNATHGGIEFTKPNSLTYQPKDNSLLVIQKTSNKHEVEIITVNITSGERSLILHDIGNEISLAKHDSQLVMDNSLLLKDGNLVIMGEDSIYKVDLTSGKSQMLSSNELGQGVKSTLLDTLSYDAEYNRLYVRDKYFYGVFSIDILTGNRSLLVSGE